MSELPEIAAADDFERERRRLQRIARGVLYGEHDAEDAVQEAWLTMLRPEAQAPRSPRAWLTATVRRVASTRAREDRRRRRREEEAARGEREPGAGQVAGRLEVLRRVLDGVEGLAEPYRGTIVQRFFDELPPREIAKRDGVPVATVRTRVRRGLAELRRVLDGEHEDEAGRVRFLAALAPMAGRAPWELGPVATLAEAVTRNGGVIVMTKQVQGVALGLVGLLLIGGLGWLALVRSAGEPGVAEVAVEPEVGGPATNAAAAEVPAREQTQRELASLSNAAQLNDWVARGVVTYAKRVALADTPLVLRLHAGHSSAGEVLAEGRVRSGEDGAFEWAAPRPQELATLAIECAEEQTFTEFRELVFAPGSAAPDELLVIVRPRDLTLVGRVLDQDGEPVEGARVSSWKGASFTTADGRFALPDSSESSMAQCRVAAEGFRVGRFQVTLGEPGERRVEDVVLEAGVVIRGRVVDERGAPIAGVEITDSMWKARTVRSDEDGRFVTDWAQADGAWETLEARTTGRPVQHHRLTEDELAGAELEWTLTRGALVSGFARDASGAPIAGVRVLAGKSPVYASLPETWTEPDGRFELRLNAGTTSLWALKEGYRSTTLPIEAPPSGETLAGLELPLEAGHFLAGRVVDERGQPVPWAHIYFDERGDDAFVPRHDADSQGRFRVDDLPDGSAKLGFLRAGYLRHEETFHQLEREDLLIRMQRCGSIAGRVVDGRTGEPVDAFRVRFVPPSRIDQGELSLRSYWAGWSSDGPGVSFVGTDGYWTTAGAEQLDVGAVTGVEVLAEGYAPTAFDRAQVQAEPDPDALVIELFDETARIEGQVIDELSGAPVADAVVRAFRGSPDVRRDDEGVETDSAGRFELDGFGSGTYSLVVDHPAFARAIDGPFELTAGQRSARHVALSAGASVSGRLLDAAGAPLAGEPVLLIAQDVPNVRTRRIEQRTTSEGSYRFEALLPGEYWIAWRRAFGSESNFALNRLVFLGEAEHESGVDLQPSGRAHVRGLIESSNGAIGVVHVSLRPKYTGPQPDEVRAERSSRTHNTVALDGRFLFEFVDAGVYVIRCEHNGQNGHVELHVPEQGEVEVRLPLR